MVYGSSAIAAFCQSLGMAASDMLCIMCPLNHGKENLHFGTYGEHHMPDNVSVHYGQVCHNLPGFPSVSLPRGQRSPLRGTEIILS